MRDFSNVFKATVSLTEKEKKGLSKFTLSGSKKVLGPPGKGREISEVRRKVPT